MAVQMHVAYSSIMRGAGIFAGGPYNCAQGDLAEALGPCMKANTPPDVKASISTTDSRANSGSIDDPANLANQKVYMFSGTDDTTVYPAVMEALFEYYQNYIQNSSIYFENQIKAAHTQPTTDPTTNACTRSYSPYVSYCEYDGAGMALNQIYGNLKPRNNGTLSGQMLEFDQSQFLSNPTGYSIAKTGYVYVPAACKENQTCTLHVAFHGCLQNYGSVGTAYIDNSGYNEWADSNNIVVLYPQTTKSLSNPSNGNACWDWWGYNNNPNTYDTQSGYQMNMVFKMIQQITSGFDSLASPTGLAATSVSETSVALHWDSVDEASGYSISRDGTILNSSPISTTSYTDESVNSGSYYMYSVSATNGQSTSAPSPPIMVQTPGTPPPLTPPTDLHVTDVTSSSISVSWDIVSGAESYNVYCNSELVNTKAVYSPSYTDSELDSSTQYSYFVTAVRGSDESSPSSTITATTSSSYVCTQYTSSNFAQVSAGRAYQELGFTYAVGSNDPMGLYNTFITTTLAETSENYYVVGNCP